MSLVQMSEPQAGALPLEPPQEADDLALVRAARSDPRAFGALYRRYVARIYRYAYVRLRNAPAAEDATSQVFLKALQALPQFRDGLFVAWLFRIAHNVVTDAVRRAPPHVELDELEQHTDTRDTPEEQAIRAIERAAFYRAFDALTEEQRTILHLTLSGLTGQEIAQILGKTHAAVKMLRWRGMESIKTRVAKDGLLTEVRQ